MSFWRPLRLFIHQVLQAFWVLGLGKIALLGPLVVERGHVTVVASELGATHPLSKVRTDIRPVQARQSSLAMMSSN